MTLLSATRRAARLAAALCALVTFVSPVGLAHADRTPGAPPEPGGDAPPADAQPSYGSTAVAARPRPLTASASEVTQRELAALPRRNAEDALRQVPGFTVVQHGSEGKGHQFFLRGFDAVHGSDLELTVEGIPLNEWSNIHAQGYLDLGIIVPEAIATVDVTRGPYTLDQGAFAMAGTADYRLGIAPWDRGLHASYTAGTTNRHRAVVSFSPRAGDGREFLIGEAVHDDGFGQRRDIDRGALLGRIRLVDSARHGTLSLLGAAQGARFSLPGTLRNDDVRQGTVDFYDAYDPAARGSSARALAALEYALSRPPHSLTLGLSGGHRRLTLLENYTGYLIDPERGDRRRQQQVTTHAGGRVRYRLQLAEQLSLLAGLGASADAFDQAQRHVGQREEGLEVERDLGGVQALAHALVGVETRPLAWLRLHTGIRLDLASVRVRDDAADGARGGGTELALSPRLTAQATAAPGVDLFASYGRGFRPPEARAFSAYVPAQTGLTEDLYRGGDPRMTVADAFEVGARLCPSHLLRLSAAGFVTLIERESVFDHVSGVSLELNSTRRIGAELEVHVDPYEWLSLTADATYVDARFVGSGNPIPLAPNLLGGLRGVLTHPSGLRAGLRVFGFAPRPLPHGARGATMAVLDASLGYQAERWSLQLDLENLLNRQVREGEYHYASHFDRAEPSSALPVIHQVAGPPLNARLTLSATF